MLSSLNIMQQWQEHRCIDTYIYYDRPLIYFTRFFDDSDVAHGTLASLLDSEDSPRLWEKWLVMEVSDARLKAIAEGKIEWQEAILSAERGRLFLVETVDIDASQVKIIHPSEIPEGDLPEKGQILLG